jgi:hypothetical protein
MLPARWFAVHVTAGDAMLPAEIFTAHRAGRGACVARYVFIAADVEPAGRRRTARVASEIPDARSSEWALRGKGCAPARYRLEHPRRPLDDEFPLGQLNGVYHGADRMAIPLLLSTSLVLGLNGAP